MDAYEGKTVRLKPVCPLCQGSMESGFLRDQTDSATQPGEWIAGEPKLWPLGMGVKMKRARRYAVSALRCESCGFLALYATRPLNDVQ
jgi:hypothetical protein